MQSEFKNSELSHQLTERHDFILLDSAKLRSHNSIQHFVKVNVAFIDLNTHLEDDTLDVHFASTVKYFQLVLHSLGQTMEKIVYRLDFDARALISS